MTNRSKLTIAMGALLTIFSLIGINQIDVVDLNARPTCPRGWFIDKNEKQGEQVWFFGKVVSSTVIPGVGRPDHPRNARWLDVLLENTPNPDISFQYDGLIVDGVSVQPFSGTIYRNKWGDRAVRCLAYIDGKWQERFLVMPAQPSIIGHPRSILAVE